MSRSTPWQYDVVWAHRTVYHSQQLQQGQGDSVAPPGVRECTASTMDPGSSRVWAGGCWAFPSRFTAGRGTPPMEEMRPARAGPVSGGGPANPLHRAVVPVPLSWIPHCMDPMHLSLNGFTPTWTLQNSFQLSLKVLVDCWSHASIYFNMEFTTRFGLHYQTTQLWDDHIPVPRELLPASYHPRADPQSEVLKPLINTGQSSPKI